MNTKLMKLSNLTAINEELANGWTFEYTVGTGANQAAILRKYDNQRSLCENQERSVVLENEILSRYSVGLNPERLPE